MRVNFKIAGERPETKRNLTEKNARSSYEGLKKNPNCEWAELIDESLENYLNVLESFGK